MQASLEYIVINETEPNQNISRILYLEPKGKDKETIVRLSWKNTDVKALNLGKPLKAPCYESLFYIIIFQS